MMRFRFVDQITEWRSGKFIAGLKTVSLEEYTLREAFGADPSLPETLVLESILQLGNWLIILTSDFQQMGMLARIDRVQFIRPLRPGETLRMRVKVVRFREDGVLFDGSGLVGDKPAIRGTGCLAPLVPLDDYEDPADLQVLSEEIARPE